MQDNILLILSSNAENYQRYFEAHKLEKLTIYKATSILEAQPYLEKATILLAEPSLAKEILNQMPKLEWLQSTWAGVNSLIAEGLRQDYVLTGVKGIFGALMSEYVFGYILLLERNILFHQAQQLKRSWIQKQPGRLQEKTIGIMGTGSIGQHIAGTAKHFGMHVLGFSYSGQVKENFNKCFSDKHLDEFLSQCDYVVCTLPDTVATTGLLNKASFKAMKATAWLINVGRGSVVHEEALLRATEAKQIAGAVLDVFVEEPLPEEHPFWQQENIFVTPHISAPSFPDDVAAIFVDNYNRFLNNKELKFQIDFERGY